MMASVDDAASSWEAAAAEFVAARSEIGSELVMQWARCLKPGSAVVDIGCGAGVPISQILIDAGFAVCGIDASPTLLSMFAQRFPEARAACETVQSSTFFGQQFDGAVAVGLIFLLSEDDQRKLIEKVGQVLRPGGRFLFSAPRVQCEWRDLQTGQRSCSLGETEYQRQLARAGMHLQNIHVDEGGNHYFDAATSSGTKS